MSVKLHVTVLSLKCWVTGHSAIISRKKQSSGLGEFCIERCELPEKELFVSVYEDDDEAEQICFEKI